MAEETKEEPPLMTEEEETSDAVEETKEEEKAPAAKSSGGKNNRRDEKPIEELFDLTKPIKRVERPSKQKHEEELQAIADDIGKLKGDRRKIQDKIEKSMGSSKNSELGKAREALYTLRNKKGALIEEKKKIRARLEATRAKADKISSDRKSAKSTMRYSKLEDIESEIKKLQRKQETTSMSLAEEKRLIKEIDALQVSKETVAELKSKDIDLEDAKEQRKAISAELNKKDKEIDAVQKEIDEKDAKLNALKEKYSNNKETMQKLFDERDAIKKAMDDKHKDRNECRAKFREANNEWYTVQRAIRAQKQIQYEEEKKKKEEEKAAWLKKKEEEEMKKIPYEEEMALCDYLADYLTKTYLTDAKEEKAKAEEEALKKKNAEVVAVSDDPFAGFKPMNKKAEDTYFSTGKGSKRKGKGKQGKKAKGKDFTLNVDSFEQFGLLNLTPPTSLENVEASVAELKAKKEWYSKQPRGSVPTAADIRKANEKAAGKIRQSNETNGSKKRGGGSGKKFALADDDFAPLSGSAASPSVNSKWGQKSAEESAEGAPTEEREASASE